MDARISVVRKINYFPYRAEIVLSGGLVVDDLLMACLVDDPLIGLDERTPILGGSSLEVFCTKTGICQNGGQFALRVVGSLEDYPESYGRTRALALGLTPSGNEYDATLKSATRFTRDEITAFSRLPGVVGPSRGASWGSYIGKHQIEFCANQEHIIRIDDDDLSLLGLLGSAEII
jgi:hypothetical protein